MSEAKTGGAFPASVTVIGGSDGTNTRAAAVSSAGAVSTATDIVTTEGTLLASAARTATTATATQTNAHGRGVLLQLWVTARAVATTLDIKVGAVDPVTGNIAYYAHSGANGVSAGQGSGLLVHPGAISADVSAGSGWYFAVAGLAIPRSWVAQVVPSDANSVTYSLGYSVI